MQKGQKFYIKSLKSNLPFELSTIKEFSIENRKYVVKKVKDRLLPLEVLVLGDMNLFFLEKETVFYVEFDNTIESIPKKYTSQFLKSLFLDRCKCDEILLFADNNHYNVSTFTKVFQAYNTQKNISNFTASKNSRTFKTERASFGIFGTAQTNFVKLYTRQSEFILEDTKLITLGLSLTPVTIKRFRYTFDIFFVEQKHSPNIRVSANYLGELKGSDTTTMIAYKNSNLIIQNQLKYLFQRSTSQKIIPYIFVGPTLGFYLGENSMDFTKIVTNYQGVKKTDIHTEADLNFSALKAGGSAGFGFDFKLNKRLFLSTQISTIFTYNYFNTETVIMNLNDIDRGGLQMNESNKSILFKFGLMKKI